MRLLASALTGVTVSLVAAFLLGAFPRRRPSRVVGSRSDRRQQWLIQAGLDLTPRQFWAASVGAGALSFGLLFLLTGVWVVAAPPAVLVALLPRAYFGRARDRKLAEIQSAWPDALRDLVASISAGMSLQRGLGELVRSGPEPIRQALARFPILARTIGVPAALEVIKEELSDPTSDRVIEVLILAHERGGAIVPEILRDLTDATTKDAWTLEEIATQSLEQRINARAVFALPWLVLLAMTLQDGPFRDFYASPGGAIVVLVGAGLSGLGMLIATRLAREPAEPRVFGGRRPGAGGAG